MEIGRPINLDDKSLIEYFVDGIPDSRANKANLYHAATIAELKTQILIYDKVRSGRQLSLGAGEKRRFEQECNKAASNRYKRCYRCGEVGHLANSCQRQRQPTCFGCNKPGHRIADCPTKKVQVKQETPRVNTLESVRAASVGCVIFKDLLTISRFRHC
ncbi:PREDICTED: cellular nucleic acid-binding protein-like [Rhagoletis zephyria]|uniref:cellular nucleic acid-binding protein-like n=1 Tax=Rhagoletis zephyria TaxID=28612 RepID=UPI00081185A7|nr:PREDICTED: cellular nucleic acid-binding protein-like [Rhagoletis zephyria]XP_036344960.1 cellular nucleic acid-binding protein-like [Rhagoletis pomonella]